MISAAHACEPDRLLDAAAIAARAHPPEADPAEDVGAVLLAAQPDPHRDDSGGVHTATMTDAGGTLAP